MKNNLLAKLKDKNLLKQFKEFDSARTFKTIQEYDLTQKIKQILFLDSFKSVLVLMVFVVFYYVFIAADRYVSETSISSSSSRKVIAASPFLRTFA